MSLPNCDDLQGFSSPPQGGETNECKTPMSGIAGSGWCRAGDKRVVFPPLKDYYEDSETKHIETVHIFTNDKKEAYLYYIPVRNRPPGNMLSFESSNTDRAKLPEHDTI